MAVSRRAKKRLAASFVALALGCAALEVGVRCVLFSESAWIRGLGLPLRRATLYADYQSDDDYWKLSQLISHDPGPVPPLSYQPLVGWVSDSIDKRSLEPIDAAAVGERRPVLLFGDSFAYCATSRDECFGALLDQSQFGSTHALVNYGVRGYGIDQVYLLLRATIDRWVEKKPIVVIGVCLDDTFDRVVLHIRGWPKPRLHVDGDRLVGSEARVPGLDALLRDDPPHIVSYAWRAIARHARWLPASWRGAGREAETTLEKRELSERILAEIHALLVARGLEHFVWLYQGREYVHGSTDLDWRESFAREALERVGLDYVSSKSAILEDRWLSDRRADDYFSSRGKLRDHYLALGNQVAFRALLEGLQREFERPRASSVLASSAFQAVTTEFRERLVAFHGAGAHEHIGLRTVDGGRTHIGYALDKRVARFHATLQGLAHASASEPCAKLKFVARIDGRSAFECAVDHATQPVELDLELTGADQLTFHVSAFGGAKASDRMLLLDPRFE